MIGCPVGVVQCVVVHTLWWWRQHNTTQAALKKQRRKPHFNASVKKPNLTTQHTHIQDHHTHSNQVKTGQHEKSSGIYCQGWRQHQHPSVIVVIINQPFFCESFADQHFYQLRWSRCKGDLHLPSSSWSKSCWICLDRYKAPQRERERERAILAFFFFWVMAGVKKSVSAGGSGQDLRSKTRTVHKKIDRAEQLPQWNYDGSSTGTSSQSVALVCVCVVSIDSALIL